MKNKLRNFLRKRILPLALGSAMSFGMSAYFPAGDVVSAEETDLNTVTVTQIASDRTLMSNGYIGILYRDDGRFLIGTTGGDPVNPDDDNRLLMYGHPKGQLDSAEAFSSFVTIKVNNLIDVFSTDSNKKYNYFFIPNDSLYMKTVEKPLIYPESGAIVTPVIICEAKKSYYNREVLLKEGDPLLEFKQILRIVDNPSTGRKDLVEISYEAENIYYQSLDLGLRIMFDTMDGENDYCLFRVPGYGDIDNETEFTGEEVSGYWQSFDDRENPSFISMGLMHPDFDMYPDKIQFCNWANVGKTEWDYQINPDKHIGDSAVTLTWEEINIECGDKIELAKTYYGLDNYALDLYVDNDRYQEVELNPVLNNYTEHVSAYIKNNTDYTVEDIEVSLDIPDTPAMTLSDDATVKIESIPPHQEVLCTWDLTIIGEGRFTYDVLLTSSDPHTNKSDHHIIETHKKELNPLNLTVNAPDELSPILFNIYNVDINATVTNDNDCAAEDIEVSLNFPGATIRNSDHAETVNIESIGPHQSQEISWNIVFAGTEEHDYTVSLKSSKPLTDKSVSKVMKGLPEEPIPSFFPPTLIPNPTETPEPEPTNTPDPVPTETPEPEPTNTPDPVPTDTPEPTNTPDPVPTETPDPEPTSTPDPVPTETPEPEPTNTPEPQPAEHPSYVLYSGSETEDFSLYCWKSTFNGDVYTGRNFVCGASELYLNGRLDTVNNVTANGWQINIDEKNENTARVDMPDWGSNILANAGNIEQFDQDVVMIEDKNIVNGSISTSGNVVINSTTFEGDCFIIADGDITYNVSDFTSTGRVVLYSRNGNVTINGNTCDLNGIIYAPNGKVSFNTNVTNINGRVFADRISFSGSVFNVTGNDSDFELID